MVKKVPHEAMKKSATGCLVYRSYYPFVIGFMSPMRILVLNQPGFKQESNEIGGFLTRGVSSSGLHPFQVAPGLTTF